METDPSLDALFNSYAVFSGRGNFNDPFDSKINFPYPTPQEVLSLIEHPKTSASKRSLLSSWISNGNFTPLSLAYMERLVVDFGRLIDSYPIYSLSCHNSCILLWAHYASCHTGFCIELEFSAEQPARVRYQSHIDSISLFDLLQWNLGIDPDTSDELGERIRNALLVKLECWSYEGEYRWIASKGMGQVSERQRYVMKKQYDPRQVKAIIFGCRMSAPVKAFILRRVPFDTKFQQAIEKRDSIEIVDFDENAHL